MALSLLGPFMGLSLALEPFMALSLASGALYDFITHWSPLALHGVLYGFITSMGTLYGFNTSIGTLMALSLALGPLWLYH